VNLLPSQVFSKHSVTYINSQGASTMNLSLLSLASLWGRLVEYQIRLSAGVKVRMSPLPGGR